MKGYVIGSGGSMRQEIEHKSGARFFSDNRHEEGFTIVGNEEQRASAKRLILETVVSLLKRKYCPWVNDSSEICMPELRHAFLQASLDFKAHSQVLSRNLLPRTH